jgi:hypothetical protein
MRKLVKSLALNAIRTFRKSHSLRFLMNQEAMSDFVFDPEFYEGRSWKQIDPVFTACRRQLLSDNSWRFGNARIREVARESFDAFTQHMNLTGKVYCDLGCGTMHPFGIATVMFLNGASDTISTDLFDANEQRAAEALCDLLSDCYSAPDSWHWSETSRDEFCARLKRFDLEALAQGDLKQGLSDLPMRHIVTDIHNPELKKDSVDIMASRAVLEHFLDFDVAAVRLFDLMRSGGVCYHHIDLVDHRSYDSDDFHHFSFLVEGDDWSDGLVNRLRSPELRSAFERAGFEIVSYDTREEQMPDGFREKITGRFRDMNDEDLSVTGVNCVLRKP